ncbi:MAG: galactokinase [Planctomycetota bacterium]
MLDRLREQFADAFDRPAASIVRSPGRVNLIGEHTDYNDGFVCPMAIEPSIWFAVSGRDDFTVNVRSTLFPEQVVTFDLMETITKDEPAWGDYVRGMAAMLKGAGIPLSGADILIDNDLPKGGGLSSSAALEVGTACCLLKVAGQEIDADRLALLAQKAEHEFAGVPCGIMDQMIVADGRQGHAMLMDCRDLAKTHVPIGSEVSVLVINTMESHSLADGEYAKRRAECEEGAKILGVKALRDATIEQVQEAEGAMSPVVFKRCRHVVGENTRTVEFAGLLNQKKYAEAGELMVASHGSLSGDYEVSTDRLDYLAAKAVKLDGVYGARMTGGGFGGCVIALVDAEHAGRTQTALTGSFEKQFGVKPEAFTTRPAGGAEVVG